MIKTVVYFMLKALLVALIEIFTFFSYLFGLVDQRLDKKTKIKFKTLTSQTVRQIIIIRKLLNISRSKDNQTMKLGQIVEFNVRNIFLQESYRK